MVQATKTSTTSAAGVQNSHDRELQAILHTLSVFMLPQGERFLDPERDFDEVSENPHWFVPQMIHALRWHGRTNPTATAAARVLAEGLDDYYDRCDKDYANQAPDDDEFTVTHYDDGYAARAYQFLTDDRVACGLRRWHDTIIGQSRSTAA